MNGANRKYLKGGRVAVALLICALFLPIQGRAQALPQPVYNGVANDNFYRVVERKAVARGFPANDNRILKTTEAMGRVAARSANASGAIATAGRALLWLPTLARRALVVGGAITISAGLSWLLNSDGKYEVPGSGEPSEYPPTSGDAYFWEVSQTYGSCGGATIDAAHEACIPLAEVAFLRTQTINGNVTAVTPTTYTGITGGNLYYEIDYVHNSEPLSRTQALPYSRRPGAPIECPSGMVVDGVCYDGAGAPQTLDDEWQAADAVPPERLTEDLDVGFVADLTDDLWREAASEPGFAGLPYDLYDPITVADVEPVRAADPAKWPKVSDVLRPVAPDAVTGTPIDIVPIPGNTPETGGPITNPGSETGPGDPVNLGTDPGIPAPDLEDIPTAEMIIAPLRESFPGLSDWTVPAHDSACPTDTFSVWGESYTIDQHCQFFEDHRAAIGAAMMVAWVLASLVIVLRA